MAYQCVPCGSKDIEIKYYQRFEAEATLYRDEKVKISEQEPGFGTKQEETNSFLHCKSCHNTSSPHDRSSFMMPLDKH